MQQFKKCGSVALIYEQSGLTAAGLDHKPSPAPMTSALDMKAESDTDI